MPNKGKGSKVAAAQARAKAAAKKKARHGGPALPAAAYTKPDPETEEALEAEEAMSDPASGSQSPLAAPSRPAGTATRTYSARTIGQRRERHATPTLTGASLKRELSMIGALTAFAGIILAVLRLMTDLGA